MDYILDIVILDKEIELAGLKEQMCEWAGTLYSREPKQFRTASGITFEQFEHTDVPQLRKSTNINLCKNAVLLHFTGSVYSELGYDINTDLSKWTQNRMLEFLKGLSALSMFYILLVREDEGIKDIYDVNTAEEIEKVLIKSLKGTALKDILISKTAIRGA